MKKPRRNTEPQGDLVDARARILAAAAQLIADGGRDAATTRNVAAAADVQAPTIYRLFGDKQGLLDAVAEHGLGHYVAAKAKRKPHADPVQELRNGWDVHVAFGLAHPALFEIMSSNHDARRLSPAMEAGREVLRRRIRNIALAGRLRVSEERALSLVQAAGIGTVLTLLSRPEGTRDAGLSRAARELVIAAIADEASLPPADSPAKAATTLGAHLDQVTDLTAGERQLLAELLERIARGGA